MITGDNLLTAIAMARKCQLFSNDKDVIVPLITSKVLKWKFLNSGCIVETIDTSNSSNFTVAMTGDQFEWIKNHRDDIINYILIRSHVFARFSPG